MMQGLGWVSLCILALGCSNAQDGPTDHTTETSASTTTVETSATTQSETGSTASSEVNYTVGIARIDTNGVRVDNQIGSRPWVDITLEFVEAVDNAVVTVDSPATWSGYGAIHVRGNSSVSYDKKQYALEIRDADGNDMDATICISDL